MMDRVNGADADRVAADIVRFARRMIGVVTSPTGLVVCCFLKAGIVLPEELLALHREGERVVGSDLLAADLIFRTGRRDAFHPGDQRYGIGHVGIYSGEHTVLHASLSEGCVSEDLIDAFFDAENGHFRGTRRIIART